MDIVTICQTTKGKTSTNCVAQKDVEAALVAGATLGACPVDATTTRMVQPAEEAVMTKGFALTGSPNPAAHVFNIQVHSGNPQTLMQIRVTDLLGITAKVKNNVVPNSSLQLGARYKAGVYLVEVVQGDQRRQLKLMKQ